MRLICSGDREISITELRQWIYTIAESSPEDMIRSLPQIVRQILKNNTGLLTAGRITGLEWRTVLRDFFFSKLVGNHKELSSLFTPFADGSVSVCALGSYVLSSVVGLGADGCVYGTEDGYCLKVVPFSGKAKLEKEYKVLCDLKHKNIVDCYDFIWDTDYAAIVLERLKPHLGCCYSYIQGLDYCHSQGILHGDIRLKNLGIDLRGNSKLFDFGEAVSTCSEVEMQQENELLRKVIFSPIALERKVKYQQEGVLC